MDSIGELDAVAELTREDRRSLALHAAIAEELCRAPDEVIARARVTLRRMRSVHPGAHPLFDEWETLLAGPVPTLLAALNDPSPWARELRHVTPFAGVLSPGARAIVYREFATAERERMESTRAVDH